MTSFGISYLSDYLMSHITRLAPISEQQVRFLGSLKTKNYKAISRAVHNLYSSRQIFRNNELIHLTPKFEIDKPTNAKAIWVLLDRYSRL